MPSPPGRYFDNSRFSDTARHRAEALGRDHAEVTRAMVLCAEMNADVRSEQAGLVHAQTRRAA